MQRCVIRLGSAEPRVSLVPGRSWKCWKCHLKLETRHFMDKLFSAKIGLPEVLAGIIHTFGEIIL